MLKCWKESPDDRPNFVDLRTEFTTLLESEACNYGYLDWLPDPKSPGTDTVFSGYEFVIPPEPSENQQFPKDDIFEWESEAVIV